MAEEKKDSKGKKDSNGSGLGSAEIVIGIFILFFIVTAAFQNFGAKIRSAEKGTAWGDLKFLFMEAKDEIGGGELSVGQSVENFRPSILYDAPGGEVLQGISKGDQGVIVEGPFQYSGNVWWKVAYNNGSLGFVTEYSLSPLGKNKGEENAGPQGPLREVYNSLQLVSTTVSFLFLIGIAYCSIRLFQIRREEDIFLEGDGTFFGEGRVSEGVLGGSGRLKWEVISKHINSESENDWRLAILEADIMLDQILRGRGFVGENLGEMLKGINKGDFQTLDQAWEAHKTRNNIAHEGINYALSAREARRIIGLFEEVFREFDYI